MTCDQDARCFATSCRACPTSPRSSPTTAISAPPRSPRATACGWTSRSRRRERAASHRSPRSTRFEHAFARLVRWRRLSRWYEGTVASARAWLAVAATAYLLTGSERHHRSDDQGLAEAEVGRASQFHSSITSHARSAGMSHHPPSQPSRNSTGRRMATTATRNSPVLGTRRLITKAPTRATAHRAIGSHNANALPTRGTASPRTANTHGTALIAIFMSNTPSWRSNDGGSSDAQTQVPFIHRLWVWPLLRFRASL